jgi:DNA-binding transcriptional regulator LsrR (DeoR family)
MAAEQGTVIKELTAIKKLLVLALANSGMTQGQIAAALDMDRTGVGRMFPKGTLSGSKKA